MKTFAPLAALYVGLAVAANWLASRYTVNVGFGYAAPAGVWAIGAILVLRDWGQQLKGLRWMMPLVPIAGALSYGIAEVAGWSGLERIAVGSVVAFFVSELVETFVFTPLRERNLTLGVALSGTVGMALDSVIFLWIAFGSQAFLPGQLIGKTEAVAVGVLLTAGRRRLVPVSIA